MAMTQKTYKTAQGKVVDMGKLVLQNETVRAVGNMKVNARGDVLGEDNRVISTKPEQVAKQYDRQVTNPRKK
jgi:glycine cleavage system H lipoate-binding protein